MSKIIPPRGLDPDLAINKTGDLREKPGIKLQAISKNEIWLKVKEEVKRQPE